MTFSRRAISTYTTFTHRRVRTEHFVSLRREAGFETRPPTSEERSLGGGIGRMLHIDDDERYRTWTEWLAEIEPPNIVDINSREGRLELMLFAALGLRRNTVSELRQSLENLWATVPLKEELVDCSRSFAIALVSKLCPSIPLESCRSTATPRIPFTKSSRHTGLSLATCSVRRGKASCGSGAAIGPPPGDVEQVRGRLHAHDSLPGLPDFADSLSLGIPVQDRAGNPDWAALHPPCGARSQRRPVRPREPSRRCRVPATLFCLGSGSLCPA